MFFIAWLSHAAAAYCAHVRLAFQGILPKLNDYTFILFEQPEEKNEGKNMISEEENSVKAFC